MAHKATTTDPQTEHTQATISPERAEQLGISADDLAAFNAAVTQYHTKTNEPQNTGIDLGPKAAAEELAKQTQEAPQEERILGKFKSQEDLAKAYEELEKKLSQQASPEKAKEEPVAQNEETEEAPAFEPRDGEQAEQEEQPQNWLEREYEEGTLASFVQQANTDLAESGELSEELLDNFENAGIPREIVQDYAAKAMEQVRNMQEAELNAENAELDKVMEHFGGEKKILELQEWATQNLSEEEIEHIDRMANEGSAQDIKFVYTQLQSRYEAAQTRAPRPTEQLVQSEGLMANPNFDIYSDPSEMLNDMRDPRYQTDPSFRAKVYEKINKSKF